MRVGGRHCVRTTGVLDLTDTATRNGFDRAALDALPASDGFLKELRQRAFEEFVTLPVPAQETEEWRYTDLSGLDLGAYASFAAGGARVDTLDDVPGGILEAAGDVGDR